MKLRRRTLFLACVPAATGCSIYGASLLLGDDAGFQEGGSARDARKDVIHDDGGASDEADAPAHRDAKGHDSATDGSRDGGACDSNCTTSLVATSCIDGGIGANVSCIPSKPVNCCANSEVKGGTFNRNDFDGGAATIATFTLDRFETTVGRFRRFVNESKGTQLNPPAAGSGANPHVPGSGWNSDWNAMLPAATTDLVNLLTCDNNPDDYPTWTDTPINNEVLPINCVDWFEAFAFCAWDGGRLPTNAELNYAQAGGSEERLYPWSNPPSNTFISPDYAVYDCTGHGGPAVYVDAGNDSSFLSCEPSDIPPVGSKSPLGDGRWGQSDLAGSLYEWTLDWNAPGFILPCHNCAQLDGGPADASLEASYYGRLERGGGYYDDETFLYTYEGYYAVPTALFDDTGIRCARDVPVK